MELVSVDVVLAEARRHLRRLPPVEAHDAAQAGAALIDIRSETVFTQDQEDSG